MGPPGAGKGTQAKFIGDTFSIPQISTGDILRDAIKRGTEMGKKAQEFINAGALVPDEVVIGIVRDRLGEDDVKKGYILDGFPRTTAQADALKSMLAGMGQALDHAVTLEVPEEELVSRLLDRASKEGRADDTEPVIRKRLETYRNQTLPLIEYYKKEGILAEIDGVGTLDDVTGRIQETLKK